MSGLPSPFTSPTTRLIQFARTSAIAPRPEGMAASPSRHFIPRPVCSANQRPPAKRDLLLCSLRECSARLIAAPLQEGFEQSVAVMLRQTPAACARFEVKVELRVKLRSCLAVLVLHGSRENLFRNPVTGPARDSAGHVDL